MWLVYVGVLVLSALLLQGLRRRGLKSMKPALAEEDDALQAAVAKHLARSRAELSDTSRSAVRSHTARRLTHARAQLR
jgi:hypothetical protein